MKIPRNINAIMMPINSTNCCFVLSILNRARIKINIKRLSTDSEYSVIQPAKNSPRAWVVFQTPSEYPNAIAALT